MRQAQIGVLALSVAAGASVHAQPAVWEQKLDLHDSCTPNAIVEILAVAVGDDGGVYASDQLHLYRTLDDGSSWDQPAFQINHIEAMTPLGGDSLLIGVVGELASQNSGIYLATDHGDTWQKTAVEEPVDYITSRSDLSLIYAVGDIQGLFVSKDHGQTWAEQFPDQHISSVVAGIRGLDYVNPGAWESADGFNWAQIPNASRPLYPTSLEGVFLTSDMDGIYRSTNNGWTWTRVLEADGGILLTDKSGHILRVGSRGEVDVSLDDGASWTAFAGSIPAACARVTEATLDKMGRIWIGTLDGAVFRSSEGTVVLESERRELPSDGPSLEIFPNPSVGVVTISLTNPSGSDSRLEIFDSIGRFVGGLHSGFLSEGSHAFQWDASGMARGAYFVRLASVKGTRSSVLFWAGH